MERTSSDVLYDVSVRGKANSETSHIYYSCLQCRTRTGDVEERNRDTVEN